MKKKILQTILKVNKMCIAIMKKRIKSNVLVNKTSITTK